MKIVITNLPSFYKINLYNRINEKCQLLVLYTGLKGSDRNTDFFKGEMLFSHVFLRGSTFMKIVQMMWVILKNRSYSELILSGWDTSIMWIAALMSYKQRNAVVIESSLNESVFTGVKGFLKRLFLKCIAKGYVSGRSQSRLLTMLKFKGKIIITKGVGIFNYIPQPPYCPREVVRTFLYVGRLVHVKNLEYLIHKFNMHPELILNIIGFGELEYSLKAIAAPNIHFLGAIENEKLNEYYQNADVFILPSLSEAWGLVVEEALNNGTPVMLSNKIGCIEEIINDDNGVVFSLENDDFEQKLTEIRDIEKYNAMRKYISSLDFEQTEKDQVKCYLDE